MAHSSVTIQVTPESRPATPSWMGEVAAFAQIFTHAGILQAISKQVRFARARFGQYDLIDFFVVLIGSVLSGEPTLLTFYERLTPFLAAWRCRGVTVACMTGFPSPFQNSMSGCVH
jgi:hypothetical protein